MRFCMLKSPRKKDKKRRYSFSKTQASNYDQVVRQFQGIKISEEKDKVEEKNPRHSLSFLTPRILSQVFSRNNHKEKEQSSEEKEPSQSFTQTLSHYLVPENDNHLDQMEKETTTTKETDREEIERKSKNLKCILAEICHQPKYLISEESQLELKQLLAGMFYRFSSYDMTKTMINLYPNLSHNQKLNAILIIEQMIQIDFYQGFLHSDFMNSIDTFIKLIETEFPDLANFILTIIQQKILETKHECYNPKEIFSRTTSTMDQKNINDLLLDPPRNLEHVAKDLANDLSLFSLTYSQCFSILDYIHFDPKNSSHQLESFYEGCDKLNDLLKNSIIKAKNPSIRKKLIAIYILTIHELLWSENGLRDLDSALRLEGVLNGIVGLDMTLESMIAELDSTIIQKWEKIQQILNPFSNFKALSALMSKETPYVPVISLQHKKCESVRNNEAWPDVYTMPGTIYLSIAEMQKKLRQITIPHAKTTLINQILLTTQVSPKVTTTPQYRERAKTQTRRTTSDISIGFTTKNSVIGKKTNGL